MTPPSVSGVRIASVAAGIRYLDRDDLVVVALPDGATTAATFTRNAFCAAPVVVAREHLACRAPAYFLINAGNANAGTGERGLADARSCCAALAEAAGCEPEQALPFSTGVIGEYLPLDRLTGILPDALNLLSEDGWDAASRAIMTTDTVAKIATRRLVVDGRSATIVGIAKGAGMIRPDMATMLAFLATDAAVGADALQQYLTAAVDQSFNCISIDGDTSTNDACVLSAAGTLGNSPVVELSSADGHVLSAAVNDICADLATAIVRDGEGATKLVRIEVCEGASMAEARAVADTIAHSPLVKTALFASDPNWGRILAAVGRAGIADLSIDLVRLWLDDCLVVSRGGRDPDYNEADGRRVMEQDSFSIRVSLGRGDSQARVLTCDLSYDYVRINAEYRT
ncbi:MAG: bifunctional glutamate N-acetyltransferase/amino-acid acetyltransferase ArgJ [Thiohalocapsa sp.]